MLQRKIPSTGELVPVVGLGSWATFDRESGAIRDVMKLFPEHGGRLIDTSPMYGNAENLIGKLSAELNISDTLFYATKVWTSGREEGIHQMESSRRKLRRDQVDLIQIHNLVDWKTHLRTLRKWKEEGKVRYIGVTHYTVSAHSTLEPIIKTEELDFVQFNYSIRVTNAEKNLLPIAKDRGVAVLINEPLEKGSLFNLVRGKALPPWAAENDIHSWAAYFLKYIIAHPAVTCVIPATSNPNNLLDNLNAGEGKLPDEKLVKMMREFIRKL